MAEGEFEQAFVPLEAGSEWRFELEAEENIALRVSATALTMGQREHVRVSWESQLPCSLEGLIWVLYS